MINRDRIYIEDLRVEGIIGIFEWEKETKQEISISYEIDQDNLTAANEDKIEAATDYKSINKAIIAFVESNKFELIENIMLEQRVNLYSDYLYKPDNIDVDYTLSAFMKINDYLSTTLIIQCLYDDNAIKKIQLREVFGLSFIIDILKLPKII